MFYYCGARSLSKLDDICDYLWSHTPVVVQTAKPQPTIDTGGSPYLEDVLRYDEDEVVQMNMLSTHLMSDLCYCFYEAQKAHRNLVMSLVIVGNSFYV